MDAKRNLQWVTFAVAKQSKHKNDTNEEAHISVDLPQMSETHWR